MRIPVDTVLYLVARNGPILKHIARENLARPLVFGMFGGELPATTIIYTKDGTGISRRKEYSGCQGIDIDPSFKVDLDNVRYSWLVACG